MFKRIIHVYSTLPLKRQPATLKEKCSMKMQPFLEQRLTKPNWCTEACATSQE